MITLEDLLLRPAARSSSHYRMRAFLLCAIAIVVFAGLGLGCVPSDSSPIDAGGGSGGQSGAGGGGGGNGSVTYTRDVKPILMAKCAPCHTTEGQGFHNLAANYADRNIRVHSLDAPASCFQDGFERMMPKTVGECVLPAIMEGWMPLAMMCFATPRPAACVSPAEQEIIAAWTAAGLPE
jgi:hypothetical protein